MATIPPVPLTSLIVPPTSRYSGTRILQDSASGQLYYGPWTPIDFPPAPDDTWEQIKGRDGLRLDLLSIKKYGVPDFYWVICRANDIQNPLTQVYGYASYAKSPIIFAADGRSCFWLRALNIGSRYNVDDVEGITFSTTNTTLKIYISGELKETFTDLSQYPYKTDGTADIQFWGAIGSVYVQCNWIATDILQPELSGIVGPQPQPTNSYLDGGVDPRTLSLRMPSISNIQTTLANAAQNLN